MARERDFYGDESGGELLAADLGPLFEKLVEKAGGFQLYIPKVPTELFLARVGEDLARALIVRMSGDIVVVPRHVYFSADRVRERVLSLYKMGETISAIAARTGISRRSAQQALRRAESSFPGAFRAAQNERVQALAKSGMSLLNIAGMCRIGAADVLSILGKAGLTIMPVKRAVRAAFSYEPLSGNRVRELWQRGYSDLRIAAEYRWPLSEVQRILNGLGAHFDEYGQPDAATAARMNSDTYSDARQSVSGDGALPSRQNEQERHSAAL